MVSRATDHLQVLASTGMASRNGLRRARPCGARWRGCAGFAPR